jgi:glycosyltransferase involved in cell wall biosynthesis
MVTVIVATKNRPHALNTCLKSMANSSRCNFELLVVQQGNRCNPISNDAYRNMPSISTFCVRRGGKSNALNSVIAKSKGEYIAFTDDDCVISDRWIHEIETTFIRHPEISCITGDTRPYKRIPIKACPSTISQKRTVFSVPQYHAIIGFGNNIAIRKSVFRSIGLFKTWLGPGSVGSNCEDGEIILRILSSGRTILHNPNMIIYHNRRLNESAMQKQNLSYLCGETACYTYYSLLGYDFAKIIVHNNILSSVNDVKKICGDIIKRGLIRPRGWGYDAAKLITRVRGCIVGTVYYIKEVLIRV